MSVQVCLVVETAAAEAEAPSRPERTETEARPTLCKIDNHKKEKITSIYIYYFLGLIFSYITVTANSLFSQVHFNMFLSHSAARPAILNYFEESDCASLN